ncbi:MAG TPA: hypothetical protein PL028_02165 [Bacteroidales bacterium]|nr:hypothetical protein [Bacteroidales bacterium]
MATKSNEVMVTVGWSVSVKIPVDPSRLKQKDYLDELRDLAVREAADGFEWKGGMVISCDEIPDLVE